MKVTETPLLDDESMDVLAAAYRLRPVTIDQLAESLDVEANGRLEDTLKALALAGFLQMRGRRLHLESPHSAFSAIASARRDRLHEETARTVTLLDALPTLIRHWHLGDAGPGEEHPLAARIVHGREDRWRAWQRHLSVERPMRPSWVLPDVSILREIPNASLAEAIGTVDVRIIVRPSELTDKANRELVALAARAGVEVRVLDDLPSWFYVDAESLAGLPVEWGETKPPSILLVTNPPVISVMNLVFEALWRRAEPVLTPPRGWESVLRLLAQGMTDDAIARTLGQDVRTVRRRVSEAMDELGATSRFVLGMEWDARIRG